MELNEKSLMLWKGLLRDLTDEELLKGIERFCRAHKEIYPNTNIVAYIREYALEDLNQPTAGEAWDMVLKEMCRCGGRYGEPKFENEVIKKSVDALGWLEICNSTNADVIRSNFYKAYDAIILKQKKQSVGR